MAAIDLYKLEYIHMLTPPPGPTFFPITLAVSLRAQPSALYIHIYNFIYHVCNVM
jgi:hypothetical protein